MIATQANTAPVTETTPAKRDLVEGKSTYNNVLARHASLEANRSFDGPGNFTPEYDAACVQAEEDLIQTRAPTITGVMYKLAQAKPFWGAQPATTMASILVADATALAEDRLVSSVMLDLAALAPGIPVPAGSPLGDLLLESRRLEGEAEATGYSDDGDTWLGEDAHAKAAELRGEIALAPCSDISDAAAKLAAVADTLKIQGGDLGSDDSDAERSVGMVVQYLARQAAACPAAPTGSGRFTALREALDAMRADHDESSEFGRRVDALIQTFHPIVRHPHVHGTTTRWLRRECLKSDPLLGPKERGALEPFIVPFAKLWDESFKQPDCDRAEDDENERLYEDICTVEGMLLATPAPDLSAMVYKAELAAREWSSDDDKFGFDDLGWVSFRLHNYMQDQSDIHFHRDLLRLAGIDHPMLHMVEFDPKEWIRDFKHAGGLVDHDHPCLILVHPPKASETVGQLLEKAASIPWAFRAIYHTAERIKGEGGGSIFDAHGGWGSRDNRGSRAGGKGYFGPAAKADRVYFSRGPAGAPVAHVEHLINGVPAEWHAALLAGELQPLVQLTPAGERGPGPGDPAIMERLAEFVEPRAEAGMAAE